MKWQIENEKLTKEFKFDNFLKAINFVNKITELAEEANHHPDILIHSYKKVKVMLKTHSEDMINQKDYDLAEKIDQIMSI